MQKSYADFDPRTLIGKVYDEYEIELTANNAILYALAIGFNLQDQLNRDHFKFTYENDSEFTVFPTIADAYTVKNFGKFSTTPGFPKIDLNMILHAEDKIEVYKPMKPDGSKYICQQKFTDF